MSWRRVSLCVVFAVWVTAAGYAAPAGIWHPLLAPGWAIGALVPDNGADNSLQVWVTVYVQLLVWAVFADLGRILWSRLRNWEASRAAHA